MWKHEAYRLYSPSDFSEANISSLVITYVTNQYEALQPRSLEERKNVYNDKLPIRYLRNVLR